MVATTRWPLTRAQQGVWFAHALDPANPCLTTAELVKLEGAVDAARLARAHDRAYAEFVMTRSVFDVDGTGPVQRIDDSTAPRLEVVDVASEAVAREWIEACLDRPMDLAAGDTVRAALLRWEDADGARAWWLHAAHHVVLDGYGAQQCLRRIADLYAAPDLEGRSDLPGIGALLAEDAELASPAEEWDAELGTFTGSVALAGRAARPATRPLRRAVQVDEATQEAVKRGARHLGLSWPDLLTAAVGSYLGRMAGLEAVRIGIPLMNRTLAGRPALASALTVCTAVNVLPLPVAGSGAVGDLLSGVAAGLDRLRARPFTRHENLSRRLEQRSPGAQLFGAQVNVVPFGQTINLGDGLAGQVVNLVAGPVDDMTITFRGVPGRGGAFSLEWDANPDLYDADQLDWHLPRLVAWLVTLSEASPDAMLDELPLVTEVERRHVLETFNDTARPHVAATLGQRFVAQARRTPEATAVVAPDGTRTYAELLAAAQRVAAGLLAEGVGPGDVVGVALERGTSLLEVVHGVVLMGAVYLPVDVDLPPARVDGMVADAGAVRVVRPGDIPDAEPWGDPTAPGLDDAAYLLFTSGSTGRPKGVVVTHRAIDNRLAWQQHHLPLRGGDRVLHKTPISFDVSIWELFWALQQGATLVVAAPGEHRDPRALAETIAGQRVAVLHFVPSMLRAFVHDPVAVKAVAEAQVRAVVTSGEALTPDLVKACREVFGVTPTNLYGPTEAAVDVTFWDCGEGDDPVPIGRPVWNTRCYVLDEQLRPVPIGVRGELWLAGVQLARGYHGRPDLTAARFVPDPYAAAPARMYRTGDVAAWRPDGALVYLGRTDDQVKIRGQRVELGEVENVLAATPGLTGVCAGTTEHGGRLVVWFTCDGDPDATERALREQAAALLPPAWLPHDWVVVPKMPLGSSGKTDRGRLATEHPPRVRRDDGHRGPQGVTEQRWCEVVAEVLGLPVVQPEDDFFALGGDSLRVLALLAAAHREFGCELRLGDVFAAPTPAALARLAMTDGQEHGEVLTLRVARCDVPRAHLVLLPPAGGLGWCYTSWLRDLPDDVSVHTVMAPGLEDGRPEPVADLEALAARQWHAIQGLVGDRPVHVAGWSLGGMAAHAFAVRAQTLGRRLASVTVVDAYPSEQWRHLGEPSERDGLVGLLRLGGVDTADLGQDRPLERNDVVRLLRESGSAVGSLPEQTLAGCVTSVLDSARLVRSSEHGLLEGDLTVVVADAPRSETWLDADGWRAHVTGTVTRVGVPARHEQLVRRPHAQQVAAILAEHLA